MWMRRVVAGVLVVGLAGVCAAGTRVAARKVACEGGKYRYLLLAAGGEAAAPVVVLMHGAGDVPENMVERWEALAGREGITLIAPELPRVAAFEAVAPAVVVCMVEDAKTVARVDARRVYLFGNSMGGYLTYDVALLRSGYFAAAAVHAMGIDKDYFGIVDRAERKIPMAIYIGDRDPLVRLADVRATRDLLVAKGFNVQYMEIRGHDHNYYGVSDVVNADAWGFLKEKRLP